MIPFKTKFRDQYLSTGYTATLAGLVGYMDCLLSITNYINGNSIPSNETKTYVDADKMVTQTKFVIDADELRAKLKATSLELIEINKEITLNKLKTDL